MPILSMFVTAEFDIIRIKIFYTLDTKLYFWRTQYPNHISKIYENEFVQLEIF